MTSMKRRKQPRGPHADDWFLAFLKHLNDFRSEHGHVRVPQSYRTAQGYPLGLKVKAVRQGAREEGRGNHTTPGMRRALDSLGFEWDVHGRSRVGETHGPWLITWQADAHRRDCGPRYDVQHECGRFTWPAATWSAIRQGSLRCRVCATGSKYHGVKRDTPSGLYIARHGTRHLGSFRDEVEAARRYDRYVYLTGKQAKINFPDDSHVRQVSR